MNKQYSKNEMMEIYNKAKIGEFDLNQLTNEQIELFNQLIEEEIRLKKEKLRMLTSC